jgi:hypothetical protein
MAKKARRPFPGHTRHRQDRAFGGDRFRKGIGATVLLNLSLGFVEYLPPKGSHWSRTTDENR